MYVVVILLLFILILTLNVILYSQKMSKTKKKYSKVLIIAIIAVASVICIDFTYILLDRYVESQYNRFIATGLFGFVMIVIFILKLPRILSDRMKLNN